MSDIRCESYDRAIAKAIRLSGGTLRPKGRDEGFEGVEFVTVPGISLLASALGDQADKPFDRCLGKLGMVAGNGLLFLSAWRWVS